MRVLLIMIFEHLSGLSWRICCLMSTTTIGHVTSTIRVGAAKLHFLNVLFGRPAALNTLIQLILTNERRIVLFGLVLQIIMKRYSSCSISYPRLSRGNRCVCVYLSGILRPLVRSHHRLIVSFVHFFTSASLLIRAPMLCSLSVELAGTGHVCAIQHASFGTCWCCWWGAVVDWRWCLCPHQLYIRYSPPPCPRALIHESVVGRRSTSPRFHRSLPIPPPLRTRRFLLLRVPTPSPRLGSARLGLAWLCVRYANVLRSHVPHLFVVVWHRSS